LRGLKQKKNWILNDKFLTFEAFMPDRRTAESRADHGLETSVNWEDDSNVLQFTLSDRTIAEFGAARLTRGAIDRAAGDVYGISNALTCERKVVPGNPHHGNLVYSHLLQSLQQRQLASALALKSQFFHPPTR
jgi:hypothetical protein